MTAPFEQNRGISELDVLLVKGMGDALIKGLYAERVGDKDEVAAQRQIFNEHEQIIHSLLLEGEK